MIAAGFFNGSTPPLNSACLNECLAISQKPTMLETASFPFIDPRNRLRSVADEPRVLTLTFYQTGSIVT